MKGLIGLTRESISWPGGVLNKKLCDSVNEEEAKKEQEHQQIDKWKLGAVEGEVHSTT